MEDPKKKVERLRGFAALFVKHRRQIAIMGGVAAHKKWPAHKFTTNEAELAGRKKGFRPGQSISPHYVSEEIAQLSPDVSIERQITVSYSSGIWSVQDSNKPAERLNFCDFKLAVGVGIQIGVTRNMSCVLLDQTGAIRKILTPEDCQCNLTKLRLHSCKTAMPS